jgi:hypothetical protein
VRGDAPISEGSRLGVPLEPQVGLEEGAQLHAPAVQTALERRLADADDRRGLLRGEALDVAQDHGRTPLGGKLCERAFEGRVELAVECLRLGAQVRRLGDRGNRILTVRYGLGGWRRAPGQPSLGLVEGDPVQPGRQLRSLLKAS